MSGLLARHIYELLSAATNVEPAATVHKYIKKQWDYVRLIYNKW